MSNRGIELIDRLAEMRSLTVDEYEELITNRSEETARYLTECAVKVRREIYGNAVYIRGLVEIGNICKNNCYYCGIRRENSRCDRYRLSNDEIAACCEEGYSLGFRTFVLQGGDDAGFGDGTLCELIGRLKKRYPNCAVTLSLGERDRESYQRLRNAGADRYLLRHETADKVHYGRLHPEEMSFDNRMRCLRDLKELGYQVGCGFMVGSPYQTAAILAKDLQFIERFEPDMCGIGPFIPHKNSPFKNKPAGTIELTCRLLSVIRLIKPNILLPATTALGTIDPFGREKGILAGANVVMPNLSPPEVRAKYELYDNKLSAAAESAQGKAELVKRMCLIGYELVTDRGDIKACSESARR